MYIRCFLFFVFLSSISGFSQNQSEKDSLLYSLNISTTQDTARVDILKKLAKVYLRSNIDSAQLFANKGLYLARKIEFDKGIGDMYLTLGHVQVIQNDMFSALDYYLKAVPLFIKSNAKV